MNDRTQAVELIELLRSRRSVRAFTDDPIPSEVLRMIAETAVYAPSAMNRQCWHFSVLTKQEEIRRLAEAVRIACGRDEGYNFYRPAAMILSSADRDFPMGRDDCACAMQNIFLSAHALGVGSVWINQVRESSEAPAVREVLTALGVPPTHAVYGAAALGYAAKPPRVTEKNLGNITYR